MAIVDEFVRRNEAQEVWKEYIYGPHGIFNTYWNSICSFDPTLANVFMTIDLIIGGGRRMRVATRAVHVTSPNGTSFSYSPVLMQEPEINSEYSMGTAGASLRSFAITVGQESDSPFNDIGGNASSHGDMFHIISGGRMLAGFGEVSLQVNNGEWANRYVIMRGDMTGGVEFGADGESMQMEIVDPKITIDMMITPYLVDKTIFPNTLDDYVGKRYPLAINNTVKSLAILVDTTAGARSFMVAWAHDMTIDEVFVDDIAYISGSPVFPWTPSYTSDSNGVPYLAVVFDDVTGTGVFEDNTQINVTMSATDEINNRTVLDTVRYLATEWSALSINGFNEDMLGRAQAKFSLTSKPTVLINGSSSQDSATAIKYIEGNLLGSYPMISMAWANGGYGPIVTDRRSDPVVAHYVIGQYPVLDRKTSFKETPKDEVYNRFTLRYAHDPIANTYSKIAIREANNSALCESSQSQVGLREMSPIESIHIYDDDTAAYVLDWYVNHNTFPSYYVEYEAHACIFLTLHLGDNITIFDKDIGNTASATVMKLAYRRGRCVLGLRLWLLYEYFING